MPQYRDKIRKTWYFRTYIVDYDGMRKQICRSGFPTKKIAKEEEQKLIDQYNQEFRDMTFNELYDIYIQSKRQTLKINSIKTLENRFTNHILPFFGNIYISKINNKIYMNWKETILEKNFGYQYKKHLHQAMVNILSYAMDFYNLNKNIASLVGGFPKNDYVQQINFYTYDEFIQFISVIKDIEYFTFFWTLFFTGLRLGEILALNWKDIKDNYIDVTKNLIKDKVNGEYKTNTPKTLTSIRKVNIDKQTQHYLRSLKEHYKQFEGFQDNWYVFGGIKPLARTTINRKKKEYSKKALIKEITNHDFRHSHATFLLSNNVPITVISKRLGHKDTNITLKVYSHFIPEDEDKAIKMIENLSVRELQENMNIKK